MKTTAKVFDFRKVFEWEKLCQAPLAPMAGLRDYFAAGGGRAGLTQRAPAVMAPLCAVPLYTSDQKNR